MNDKTCTVALSIVAVLAIALYAIDPGDGPGSDAVFGPAPYSQPRDGDIREIVVTDVHDGDTIRCDVRMGELGGTDIWARGVRLRLKGVSALEIDSDDIPQREVAIIEREALNNLLRQSKTPITARIFRHGTYDRHDASIYTDTADVNAAMRTYPQGGK